ncbi:CoA transferase [Catenulispora yoronensis]
MADLGARIVEVDHPATGDDSRRYGPFAHDGRSMYFARVNRGTQSLAVDLKKDPNRSQRWPSTPMCWWGTSSPESWTGSARGDPGTQRPPNRPVIATSPTQVLRPPWNSPRQTWATSKILARFPGQAEWIIAALGSGELRALGPALVPHGSLCRDRVRHGRCSGVVDGRVVRG